MNNNLLIRQATKQDNQWLEEIMEKDWGGLPLVIRGKKYYPNALDGLIVEINHEIKGFLYYEIQNNHCEIVVFEIYDKFKGIGTQMLEKLKDIVKNKNCKRIYLQTGNDNMDALRFYQRRGFHICAIHINSIENSRKIKPTIGLIGEYNIPLRDEIDLELFL